MAKLKRAGSEVQMRVIDEIDAAASNEAVGRSAGRPAEWTLARWRSASAPSG